MKEEVEKKCFEKKKKGKKRRNRWLTNGELWEKDKKNWSWKSHASFCWTSVEQYRKKANKLSKIEAEKDELKEKASKITEERHRNFREILNCLSKCWKVFHQFLNLNKLRSLWGEQLSWRVCANSQNRFLLRNQTFFLMIFLDDSRLNELK